MSDLISRQDAIDVFEILADKMSDAGQTVMAQAVAVLKDLRSAEPERKKGKWILLDGYRCSVCNHKLQSTGIPTFCPNCGARMEWE